MAFFTNAYIKLERKVSSGYSDLGETNSSFGLVKDKIPVQIIKKEFADDNSQLYYVEAGQVAPPLYIVTCNSYFDFRREDKITVTSTPTNSLVSVGDTYTVIEIPYKGNLLKHVKMFAKFGVEE